MPADALAVRALFESGLPLTICITGAGRARKCDKLAAPESPSTAETAPRAMNLSLRAGRAENLRPGASMLGLTVCAEAALIKLVGISSTCLRADFRGSIDSLTSL